MTPTLVASQAYGSSLPLSPEEGAGLAWGGPSLRPTGPFISFEGIDGAGKTTHISALADAFASAGRAVTLTREPGGTALAEKLRALVLNDAMDALTESLLIFAARRDHLVTVILPALARGDVVLCDRFTDATFAYQGSGRGFDQAVLGTLEMWVQSDSQTGEILQPDLTVWFDLDPVEAATRLTVARVPDKFETQNVAFFTRVAEGYASRAKAQPARFARVDASQTRGAVWHDVRQSVAAKGWL